MNSNACPCYQRVNGCGTGENYDGRVILPLLIEDVGQPAGFHRNWVSPLSPGGGKGLFAAGMGVPMPNRDRSGGRPLMLCLFSGARAEVAASTLFLGNYLTFWDSCG
jgi:hypothetical protein